MMASVQYEVAVVIPAKPGIDTQAKTGVNSTVEAARVHATPALLEVRRVMREIRASGKCGMLVARWDGQAWCIHRCDPPARVNEA